jgi:hypothetical protein
MSVSRRRLLVAGRTGLLGLAGVTFVAAGRAATDSLSSDAKPRGGKKQKGKKPGQKHQHAKGPRHHRRKKNGHNRKQNGQKKKKQRNGKDIHLRTGSVLPESLISDEGGRLSVHMLLPFETFSSEAQLADAVAEAEEMNLFILPQDPQTNETAPAA